MRGRAADLRQRYGQISLQVLEHSRAIDAIAFAVT